MNYGSMNSFSGVATTNQTTKIVKIGFAKIAKGLKSVFFSQNAPS